MNKASRLFFLFLAVLGIIASIVYLENIKAPSNSYDTKYELVNPDAFLNSEPFTLTEQIGKKVVLVDFWTYSCINCQRTFPYLNQWWEKYKDKGLLIVGVHTPEFEFEKEKSNVEDAVTQFGIQYPVVMDNNRETWNAFQNRYWPHEYLFDIHGNLIYDHIGEGNYEETEKQIQILLGQAMEITTPTGVVEVDFEKIESPETYFGSERASNVTFSTSEPTVLEPNEAVVLGDWTQELEFIETSGNNASVLFEYNAKSVYMVASADKDTEVEVWVDGQLLKTMLIQPNSLYTLVEGNDYGTHTLKLVPKGPGFKLFTFTFG